MNTVRAKGRVTAIKDMAWAKDAEFKQYGLFSELNWNVTDGERLITGVRVDRHKVEDHRDYRPCAV